MLELQGKYASAKVFTDVVDSESISQVINLLNQPYVEGSKVRMMPDIHAGAGCTIGTTMTIKDKICPNLVGVDIGCGMETIRLKETNIEPQKLDKVIREGIPSGFAIRSAPHRYAKEAFTVSEFKKQMAGIYTTSVGRSTLDECPMAYKGMDDIVGNIEPAVTIDAIIKPIYNFKAGDED